MSHSPVLCTLTLLRLNKKNKLQRISTSKTPRIYPHGGTNDGTDVSFNSDQHPLVHVIQNTHNMDFQ